MMVMLASCSNKPVYIQQPFLGFTTYPKPPKITFEVERGCVASYMINDYRTTVKVGDCVRVEDVKKLIEKIRKLEQMRALDANLSIGVGYIKNVPISVDTREDLLEVEKLI